MNHSNTTRRSPSICDSHYLPAILFASFVFILLSFIGNGLLIHIIRRNKTLHNFTNFLLAQKSILDILISFIVIPSMVLILFYKDHLLSTPPVGLVLKGLTNVLLFNACFTASLISVDRFLAIFYPLVCAKVFRRTKSTFPITWFFSISLGSATSYFNWLHMYRSQSFILENSLFVGIFLVPPMTTTGILYAAICFKLCRRTIPGNASSRNQEARRRKTRKVVMVLIVMTISCYISWVPLLLEIGYKTCSEVLVAFAVSSDGIFMPCLYLTLIEQFRTEFKKLLRGTMCTSKIGRASHVGERQLGVCYEETKL